MTLAIPPTVFREYDIRGIAGKDLSSEFARLLGEVYARYLRERLPSGDRRLRVSVGRDCRLTSDSYADALINGLRKGGLDVVRLGICASPLTYFSIHHLDLDGGIMVTASHNTGDYNGFKICVGRDTLHGAQVQEIRGLMEKGARQGFPPAPAGPAERHATITDYAIIPPYIEELVSRARALKPFKIVIDAGNGTASTIAPGLFERLGARVVPLYCELDGRFPNHHPDPTVPENLRDLADRVRAEKADFGVGFDGDSDRIGIVDENGRVLFGDELLVLYARDVLREHPGATIIADVKSSHRLYQDIADRGGTAIMWKAGHSLIKSKMKDAQALLAGELSGHIFFADRYFGFDDAIYAALRFWEILSASGGTASALLRGLPPTVATPEIRVECMEERKFELIDETRKRLQGMGRLTELDGVRVDLDDGWGLVRASNTQPAVVLRYEAATQSRLQELRSMIEKTLKDAAQAIGHPPLTISGNGH